MKKVAYEYWVDGPVLGIHDLHGEESVAVHALEVLLEIQAEIGSLEGKLAIWRGADHLWDGLLYRDNRVDIYPLGCTSFEAAKEALAKLPAHRRLEYTLDGDLLKAGR